jgi:predicted nucleotide-binding protein
VKSSNSITRRFSGATGKKKLLECLLSQSLVIGNQPVAKLLRNHGKVKKFKKGDIIIAQGGYDSDIYFILTGTVEVLVNDRHVASRNSQTHVGEMALIDTETKRSATIKATEECVLFQVPEHDFTKIADAHPVMWRKMASILSIRLQERNKFHRQPNLKPVVFIGSSSEALGIAKAISESLNKLSVSTRLWTKGVFNASQTAIEDLTKSTSESDFALVLLTPDDVTVARNKRRSAPRDNAVFELGLFMGALGRDRTFIVMPQGADVKIPTDLLGVTCLRYMEKSRETLVNQIKPICKAIKKIVLDLGSY